MIQAVFFDAAGTLIRPVRNVGESYATLAADFGLHVSSAAVMDRFRDCFAGAPPLAFPRAQPDQLKVLERTWWKDLVEEVFSPLGTFADFDGYFAALFDYFAQPSAWELYPDVTETLSTLKGKGLSMDVVSNFDSRLIAILEGLNVASFFDAIIVSSHAGFAKPDPRIFHESLRRRSLSGAQALHVGDSPQHDLAGAQNADMTALLIDRRQAASNDGTISDLRQVLNHLTR